MSITNAKKFKGEIEKYLSCGINNIELKIEATFPTAYTNYENCVFRLFGTIVNNYIYLVGN